MPREAEPSLNEKQFVIQALQENLRLDGREFDHYRPLELTFGDQYGVADVTLGKTRYAFEAISPLRLIPFLTRPPEFSPKQQPK
jgi:exosome complex component RRP45